MTTGSDPANSQETPGNEHGLESGAPAPAAGQHALCTLSPAECLDLLGPGGIGRVGFISADGIMMLPVNFVMTGKGTIVFRTAPDTLLALYANNRVSFQADRFDEALREGWSVLVHGHAHKITDERQVRHIEDWTHLQPWAAGARDVYVRIVPDRITGRRLQAGGATPPAWPASGVPTAMTGRGTEM